MALFGIVYLLQIDIFNNQDRHSMSKAPITRPTLPRALIISDTFAL